MKLKLCILILASLMNCISSVYSKKYNPEEYSYSTKEFRELQDVSVGRVVTNPEVKSVFQFDSILIGEKRFLNLEMDPDKKIIHLSDDFKYQEGKPGAVILNRIGGVFFNEDKKVNESELLKIGLKVENFPEEIVLIRVVDKLGLYQNAQYVRIKRSEDNKEVFIKEHLPKTAYISTDKITWQVRDKFTYTAKKAFYYLGFVVTVPLDIVTLPFQAVGAIYILFSGGFVK